MKNVTEKKYCYYIALLWPEGENYGLKMINKMFQKGTNIKTVPKFSTFLQERSNKKNR